MTKMKKNISAGIECVVLVLNLGARKKRWLRFNWIWFRNGNVRFWATCHGRKSFIAFVPFCTQHDRNFKTSQGAVMQPPDCWRWLVLSHPSHNSWDKTQQLTRTRRKHFDSVGATHQETRTCPSDFSVDYQRGTLNKTSSPEIDPALFSVSPQRSYLAKSFLLLFGYNRCLVELHVIWP